MTVIFSFLVFDYVYLMTQGGPAHATEMLSTYAYSNAFYELQCRARRRRSALVMSMFGLRRHVLLHPAQPKET